MSSDTTSLKDEIYSNRNYIFRVLAEKGFLGRVTKRFKEEGNFLKLQTTINYKRTTKERSLLDEITERTGTKIITKDTRDHNGEKREYEIRDFQERHIATLTSERRLSKWKKSVRRLGKPMPLEISVNLEYPEPKVTTDFLGYIIDIFYYTNPLCEEKV